MKRHRVHRDWDYLRLLLLPFVIVLVLLLMVLWLLDPDEHEEPSQVRRKCD